MAAFTSLPAEQPAAHKTHVPGPEDILILCAGRQKKQTNLHGKDNKK